MIDRFVGRRDACVEPTNISHHQCVQDEISASQASWYDRCHVSGSTGSQRLIKSRFSSSASHHPRIIVWNSKRCADDCVTAQIADAVHSREICNWQLNGECRHCFLAELDCCNFVLFGLPASILALVQRVQNVAARLAFRLDSVRKERFLRPRS